MKQINLIFGCHGHQPVGNFDFVFQEAYEKSYKPFIDVLERFPAIHVTLHYTGPLLDWFEAHAPDFLQRLAALVERGQVEIMGGGYYEPLLCAIPERDAIAQIQRMHDFCERHFGARPRGMWLTERVWEPQMAGTLAKAGVEYTALDDTHFLCSGFMRDELFGYYMTEHEGRTLKIFPIQERLRYLIPFHGVEESIEFLREHATEDGLRCAVIHDDSEKFGIWPGTYNSVYKERWLERFFQALTDNQDWLHALTYSEYLERARALGRTYITCASYVEMMEWALPTPVQRKLHGLVQGLKENPDYFQEIEPFIRGGFWRSFLAKYEESNNLQKRMLQVSNRLASLRKTHGAAETLAQAEKLLHEAQCNCAYWHGVFGGLYLNHLRTALYEKMIAADVLLDSLEYEADTPWIHCETRDFDGDGNPEGLLSNRKMALFVDPLDGGTLFELDFKPQPFNLLNTLTRREEPYHDSLRSGHAQVGEAAEGNQSIHEIVRVKEAGLVSHLLYDSYRRSSLRDHFLGLEVSPEALWSNTYESLGDFATGAYHMECAEDALSLHREGTVYTPEAQQFSIHKTLRLDPDTAIVDIAYHITHREGSACTVRFGIEWVINMLTGSAPDRYYRSDNKDLKRLQLGAKTTFSGLAHLALCDGWMQLEFSLGLSLPADILCYPIETISQSEGGQERVYQGSVVTPTWILESQPGQTHELRLSASVHQMPQE